MAGGHSIKDSELKFGLAVVGTVHPDRLVKNSTARAGDRLVLTKPLGSGCLTTALRSGDAKPEHIDAGQRIMARLNRNAAEAMLQVGAHAATDITGYGLVGHAFEMADGAGVSIRLHAESIPVLEEAKPYIKSQFTCGGSRRNEEFGAERVQISAEVAEYHRILIHDVQTSGGLLIAVPEERSEELLGLLRSGGDDQAAEVGEILSSGPPILVV